MTQTDYGQKKRECWLELIGNAQLYSLSRCDIFSATFDRAYALGKQERDAVGEPKYSIGQLVYLNGVKFPFKVTDFSFHEGGEFRYSVLGRNETYTEDELSPADNVNLSQETANCDKQFDKILNDSLRERNRLNIAAMIEPALISCPDLWKRHGNYYAGPGKETRYSFAKLALEYADALIAECESFEQKGGRQ